MAKTSSLCIRIAFAAQGMSSIMEVWISQANARQRSGRAGRVRSGNCFCLYTRNRLEKLMRPFQVLIFLPFRCIWVCAVRVFVLHWRGWFPDRCIGNSKMLSSSCCIYIYI